MQSQPKRERRKFFIFLCISVFLFVLLNCLYSYQGGQQSPSTNIGSTHIQFMVIIGFGLLFNSIIKCTWSTLLYSLLLFTISLSFYFPLKAILKGVVSNQCIPEQSGMQELINGFRGCLPSIIAYGCVSGRVTPNQILLIGLFGTLGYTFMDTYGRQSFCVYDQGGTIFIFLYGSVYGLTLNKIIGQEAYPSQRKIKQLTQSGSSDYLSILGIFLLFVFWPSFNYPYHEGSGDCDGFIVVKNTIVCMIASISASFLYWATFQTKMSFKLFTRLIISAGIIAGAFSGLVNQLGPVLCFGGLSVGICFLAFHYCGQQLTSRLKILDVSSIMFSIAIPSLFGGIFSGLCFIRTDLISDQNNTCISVFKRQGFSALNQMVVQYLAILIAIICGIIFGAVVGILINYCCNSSQISTDIIKEEYDNKENLKQRENKRTYDDNYTFQYVESDPLFCEQVKKARRQVRLGIVLDFA